MDNHPFLSFTPADGRLSLYAATSVVHMGIESSILSYRPRLTVTIKGFRLSLCA